VDDPKTYTILNLHIAQSKILQSHNLCLLPKICRGELVGETSFETLSKIYTGYGEDGPQQGNLHKYGMNETMKEQFPKIDYINKCVVVDETGIESSVVLNK